MHEPNTDALQPPSWETLAEFAESYARYDVAVAFANNPQRFEQLSASACGIFVDTSKNLWDQNIQQQLLRLAAARGVFSLREQMFAGDVINLSEQRQVLHVALRGSGEAKACTMAAMERQRFIEFAEQLRTNGQITDVVNIGIGGSTLGPQLICDALTDAAELARIHFIDNVDARRLERLFTQLQPASTLFIICSKTFTTSETMVNADRARSWFLAAGGSNISDHFVAVSVNGQAVSNWGIKHCFAFWDWVGGRYSVWSAVGLVAAIALGKDQFNALLAGAQAMDSHFLTATNEHNLPLMLGVLDVWNHSLLKIPSRCVVPYSEALNLLPAYLQQLEMESGGKRVDRYGIPLNMPSAPVIWGGQGLSSQHSFFQLLHQGTQHVAVDFYVLREQRDKELSRLVMSNALAQSRALMCGTKNGEDDLRLGQTRQYPGNRPSTMIMLEHLDAWHLGALLAMNEHRVFVFGAMLGINSFDQWGVELGKKIVNQLNTDFDHPERIKPALDQSSAGLIRHWLGS